MIKFAALTGQGQKVIIYFQNELLLNRPGCSANPPGKKGKILIGEIIMTQIDETKVCFTLRNITCTLNFLLKNYTAKLQELVNFKYKS